MFRALTAVVGLYLLLLGTNASGEIVGWWNFDDGTATDLSGNQHHGTFVGNATVLSDPLRGNVLSLNGSRWSPSFVSLANPTSSDLPAGSSARSMVAWAKLNVTDGYIESILSYGSPGPWKDAMFMGRWNSELVGGGWAHCCEEVTVPGFWDTDWHFIALTYDGAYATLYADWNGTTGLRKSEARTWNLTLRNAYIGTQVYDYPDPTGNYEDWNGLIDDVAIFNTALSDNDIASIYRNGLDAFVKPVPEPSGTMMWLGAVATFGLVRRCRGRRRDTAE